MMPVLTRAQMRAYDRYAMETCGVPGLVLMENAGRSAAELVAGYLRSSSPSVVVVAGAGNNGGDGFVVARHLATNGVGVCVVLLVRREAISGDARTNLDAYLGTGGHVLDLVDPAPMDPLEAALAHADVVVDAIFGTGLARPVTGHIAAAIATINRCGRCCIAIDVPSGLDADTGSALGTSVRADVTVTFGHYKLGLLTPEGSLLSGEVVVSGLGLPDSAILAHVGHAAEVIRAEEVGAALTRREPTVYKHAAGDVLVVGGSHGKIGAPLLAATAALRSGAGLATIATWPETAAVLGSRVVEVMTTEIDPDRLEASLDAALKRRSAVVVGPGLGLDERARRAVDHVVLDWDGPKIIDADAITLFAGRAEVIAGAKGRPILTPHAGEMAKLLGTTSAMVERDRFAAAREAALRTGAIVVLKGARTIVAAPSTDRQKDPNLSVCLAGNAALATAGSGDVLSGILAAFSCVLPPEEAARAAVLAHGMAGDAWVRRTGSDRGLLAGEIADEMPNVLASLVRARRPGPHTS